MLSIFVEELDMDSIIIFFLKLMNRQKEKIIGPEIDENTFKLIRGIIQSNKILIKFCKDSKKSKKYIYL